MPTLSSYILQMAQHRELTAFIEQGVYRSQPLQFGAGRRWLFRRGCAKNNWEPGPGMNLHAWFCGPRPVRDGL